MEKKRLRILSIFVYQKKFFQEIKNLIYFQKKLLQNKMVKIKLELKKIDII